MSERRLNAELDRLQQDAVGYFLRAANPTNGLIADSSRDSAPCSIAITGLGLAAHLRTMHAAILEHLDKEEQVLFPLLRAGRGSGAGSPIHAMEQEHVDHGRALDRLRELTANLTAPAEACPTWRALYLRLGRLADELMEHIHLENNVLFPRALFA